MVTKSSRAVLRAVVLPALGLTSVELLVPACDRSSQQTTVEQSNRQIAVPGMPSEPMPQTQDSGVAPSDTGVAEPPPREIPAPGTIVEEPPPPRPDDGVVRRPPPGPPAIRPRPGSLIPRPGLRPTPGSTEPIAGLTNKRGTEASDATDKPEARTARRGRTPPSSGSLPGIAGARPRRAR